MNFKNWTLALGALALAASAQAADINRKIVAEFDPVAPSSAAYDHAASGIDASKFGAGVDFNLAGVFSTGPELWTGNFNIEGKDAQPNGYSRDELFPGEKEKISAIRLRWNVTAWEQPASMRGWYFRAAYSYTKVDSRANMYTTTSTGNDAIPANFFGGSPDDNIDLITDTRHGVAFELGNRWMLWNQNLSVTLGASITGNFKRTVSVESKDPNARSNYDALLEKLADTRMNTRPTPEANLGLGYAW